MEVYTPQEVKEKLFVGKNKVYELLKTGKLKHFRVGKQYRIPKSELDKFMEKYPNFPDTTSCSNFIEDSLPKLDIEANTPITVILKPIKIFLERWRNKS